MMYTTRDYTGKVISKWKLAQVLAVEKVLHSCYNNEIQDIRFWPSNRPTAEKANFESLIGLVFNLLSVKIFDKNRKI